VIRLLFHQVSMPLLFQPCIMYGMDSDTYDSIVLTVPFFLLRRRVGTSGVENSRVGDSGRKKRKRQNFITERNSERHLDSSSEIWEDLGGPNISPHCHTNQAFAVAVKTFMQGNLASLDKIRSFVNHRRQVALGGRSVLLSEVVDGGAGLVFGFGCGDVTLLELFLHSDKQREQLQASFKLLSDFNFNFHSYFFIECPFNGVIL